MTAALDLPRLRGLVEVMAAERTKEAPHLFEDAVQEGMIAAWEASEARPDAPAAYVHGAARKGVLTVVSGRPLTGQEGRRGWQDAHDSTVPLVVQSDEGEEFALEPACPRAAQALQSVGLEHVREAVAALPAEDAALVYARYWRGLSFAEASVVLGRPAGTLARRWTTLVRPALASALTATTESDPTA